MLGTKGYYKKLETHNNRTVRSNTLISWILLIFPSFPSIIYNKIRHQWVF